MDFIGNIFGYIIYYGYKWTGIYLVGLIAFTIVVKVVMFPLSVHQQKNMAKQQRLQPKLNELKEKYKNNKMKLQEETSALYAKEGSNPMGGCLPLLIQFPIIIGLYSAVTKPLANVFHYSTDAIAKGVEILNVSEKAFYKEIDFVHAFANATSAQLSDLGQVFSADQMTELGELSNGAFNMFGLDLLSTPSWTTALVIIPLLCFITSMGLSLISTANASQPQGGCTKFGMPISMSIFSTYIAFTVPASVGVYWILSNIVAVGQTVALKKIYTPQSFNAKEEGSRLARRRNEEKALMESKGVINLEEQTAYLKNKDIKNYEEQLQKQKEQEEAIERKRRLAQNNISASNTAVIKTGNATKNNSNNKKKKK